MNRDFKLNTQGESPSANRAQSGSDLNDEFNRVRNLYFIWPDGRKMFRNYAYMIGCNYFPDDDVLQVVFTTDTFILHGVALEALSDKLYNHLPREIECIDERYNAAQKIETIVNKIEVSKTDK